MLVIAGTSAEQPIIYYEHAFKYVEWGGGGGSLQHMTLKD